MADLQLKPITILGAGSWGTALALHLARSGQEVRLWSYDISEVAAMLAERTNNQFLAGFPFPDSIYPTANLSLAAKDIQDIIVAVPSIGYRDTLIMLKPLMHAKLRLTCATKGLDADTGQLLHQVADEILGHDCTFAVLSGPSFAREVAAGLPTAVSIASQDKQLLLDLVQRFNGPCFRVEPNDDIIGTEIGSVIKNIIAIATGVSDGMGYGTNTRCAIITDGLKEMIALGTSLGAKKETFIGLSGMGDLILTASDDQSRNRRLGLGLGKGYDLPTIEKDIGQVVEGKRNAELLMLLAEKQGIVMPICQAIHELLQGKITLTDAFAKMFGQDS